MRVFQNAVLQHGLRAGKAQRVRALLVRLEHQLHAAVQLFLALFQHFGGGKQHGRVRVVPTGVRRIAGGGKIKARFLLHGQRIHVGSQEDSLSPRFAHSGHDTCLAHALRGIAHCLQLFLHKGACLLQFKAQLRVAVQPAAVFQQFRPQFFCALQQFFHDRFASLPIILE